MEDKIKTLIMGEEYEMLLLMMQNNPELAQEFVRMMFNQCPKDIIEDCLTRWKHRIGGAFHLAKDGFPFNGVITDSKVILNASSNFGGLNITDENFPNLVELEVINCGGITIEKGLRFIETRERNLSIIIPPKDMLYWVDWGDKLVESYKDEGVNNGFTPFVTQLGLRLGSILSFTWQSNSSWRNSFIELFPNIIELHVKNSSDVRIWRSVSEKELKQIKTITKKYFKTVRTLVCDGVYYTI